jgi:DUF2075 family protein/DNA replication protein DnaC
MLGIATFKFKKDQFEKIKEYHFGLNWPVVYLIKNDKEIYIGETSSLYNRSNQHYDNPERRKLNEIHVITDEEYNKSATLDIESSLIQYIAADGKFILQNSNHGLQNHNYFDREKYKAKFEIIWKELQSMSLAENELIQIKNSDLFKYSPYKSLTIDQKEVADELLHEIKLGQERSYIINGDPGTGKTILATYLFKQLSEIKETKHLKVALVVPMTGLRGTLKKIFKNIKGLKSSMVIGPSNVTKKYDILIVDEAHRLKQRKNITNYKSFDDNNKLLGLDKNATELDWIMKCSKIQILFYDKNQSVRPSDISPAKFEELTIKKFELKSQLRIGGGDDGERYIKFVQDIFDLIEVNTDKLNNYDFQIYENIERMVSDIKEKDLQMDLCRMVSGYAWPWISKNNPNNHDIEIGDVKLKWNSVNHNWVYSQNAINEVGCIHTVQGYDLNYTGVIIGPEISYDPLKKKFIIFPEKYMDMNGKRGVSDNKELERYIINIYKTLLTRGIHGTYVYIVDDCLRKYFKDSLLNKVK